MERRICTWTLLSLVTVLSGVGALNVNIPKDLYEHARGDNITLPCTFKPKDSSKVPLIIISWSAEAEKAGAKETLILTYYSVGKVTDITSMYEGRASLDVDVATGKADLKLSSITLADNKQFECRVQIPNDDEGKPADTARLVVLVAPSTPICKIEGRAEYGQNIKLTCVSEEGSPAPTYSWKSEDVRHMPRAPDPRTTDKGGVLSLFNITKETSGYYICTSSNKIRSATCNITLAVMPPSMNLGSTAGIIGGVVALLVVGLLILIIYCCCCRKKKNEEYAMGVAGDEYTGKKPVGNGESRRADGQEDARRYDDSVRSPPERSDRYEDENEHDHENRRDYDGRRSDHDERRSDYDERRSDYDERRSDYDEHRSDYSDRRERFNDRNERYDDDRHHDDDRRYDDRRHDDDRRYDDRRYDDERRYDDRRDRRNDDDRYDEPYDDRDRDRPPVPANKPGRMDYDD